MKKTTKETWLDQFATNILMSLSEPEIAGRKAITARRVDGKLAEITAGPRAGAVTLLDAAYSNQLIETLSKNDGLLAHKLLPKQWGKKVLRVAVYGFQGKVRIEAAWPRDMQELDVTISLSRLDKNPYKNGRFLIGRNERGASITLGLSDATPNYLFAGFTGSGKTYAMRSVAGQMSRYTDTQTVLIDGKYGDSLGCLNGIKGQVGPLAIENEDARNALFWAINKMRQRYLKISNAPMSERKKLLAEFPRIVVVIDEVQEFTKDKGIAAAISKLIAQGRGAKVYCLLGTQHPKQDTFNDSKTKRNLVGRVVLAVEDSSASYVALGEWSPDASKVLLGAGDAYAKVPGAMQRVQVAYIPDADLDRIAGGKPLMEKWPQYDPVNLGFDAPDIGRPQVAFTIQELAISAYCHQLGGKRPTLEKLLKKHTGASMGVGRLQRLMSEGKELDAELDVLGYGGIE